MEEDSVKIFNKFSNFTLANKVIYMRLGWIEGQSGPLSLPPPHHHKYQGWVRERDITENLCLSPRPHPHINEGGVNGETMGIIFPWVSTPTSPPYIRG